MRGSAKAHAPRNDGYSMIPESVQRFSEKIMLKQRAEAGCRFEEKIIPL